MKNWLLENEIADSRCRPKRMNECYSPPALTWTTQDAPSQIPIKMNEFSAKVETTAEYAADVVSR